MEELLCSCPHEGLIPIIPFYDCVINIDVVVDGARITVEGILTVSVALWTQLSVTPGTSGSLPCI